MKKRPAIGHDHPYMETEPHPEEDITVRLGLFEPFETTKEHGNGLGLAIVRKVVELHGGRVSVETAPEGGTVFHVDLPAGCPSEEPQEDPITGTLEEN